MWIGQWNSTYKNSLQREAERQPMKKDWEIYRDTGILGGYIPVLYHVCISGRAVCDGNGQAARIH